VTGAAGVFFALFGMVRLGVWLDSGLLVASVAMFALASRRANPASSRRSKRTATRSSYFGRFGGRMAASEPVVR
jgi:hypothetical protein